MNSHPYAFLALFAAVAVAIPLVFLAVAQLWFRFFQPAKPSALKGDVYECGLASSGDSWIQFKAHYYLYAILFLIFEIESVFLFPWTVVYKGLGPFAFWEMMLFMSMLLFGLVYAWRKGVLTWE